jgi:cellulose synthase/poly-beta-1,6-N-acetylglucosamine synthase-like glycosyltransferase
VLTLTLLRCVYLVLIAPLVLYGLGAFYLLLVYFRHRGAHQAPPPAGADEQLPRVTVQIPLYNERHVAGRAIAAAAALNYPHDRLHIQVLDDSTDDTTSQVAAQIAALRAAGVPIDLLHRSERTGFKGGALANGLAQTDGEFIAVFDADFVPQPNFLRRIIGYFLDDPRVGAVQTRWTHLNAGESWLTRSQALMLDGHFAVEQFARSQGQLLFNFNGTCGVLRRRCIEDAGGWQTDTLTEDADLSVRAQIRGWRFVFVRDIATPGELPPQMIGFKIQQARWAAGTTQVLLKLGAALWRAPLTFRQRVMAILSLCAYPVQPFSLGVLLMMPWMIVTGALDTLPLAPLGLLGATVPILYASGQAALHAYWPLRSLWIPVLMTFSAGLSLNNTLAVLAALRGKPGEFRRTPKFNVGARPGHSWRLSQYAAAADAYTFWEIGLGVYALGGMVIAAWHAPPLIPYFLLYVVGFFAVAGWSAADRLAAMPGHAG